MSYLFHCTETKVSATVPLITTEDATNTNDNGADLNIQTGIGDGNGSGGDINLITGQGGISGTQGAINFSALGATKTISVNEPASLELNDCFTASSIVGALNELKGPCDTGLLVEGTYSNIVDINFNGTTPVEVSGLKVDITTGTWLIGYNMTITSSNASAGINIDAVGSVGGLIPASQTFIRDFSTTQRHAINKQFIYTAAADETIQVRFASTSGATTSAAIEMTPISSFNNPDQILNIWATDITAFTNDQAVYAAGNINYNSASQVDVAGASITLPAGNWLIGYTITMETPDNNENIIVNIRDNSNVILANSSTYVKRTTTSLYHNVSKTTVFNGSGTYKLSFALESGATSTGTAIDTSGTNGVGTPVIWAVDTSSITAVEMNYSGADINYNLFNFADIPANITLTAGVWIVGYEFAINNNSFNTNDIIACIRDSSDNIVLASQSFIKNTNTATINTICKTFVLQETAGNTYKMSFKIDLGENNEVAISNTTLNPNVPNIFAVRIQDIISNNTFINLSDTPADYLGSANKFVSVNALENRLEFTDITVDPCSDDLTLPATGVIKYGVCTSAELISAIQSGNRHIFVNSGNYSITTPINVGSNTTIEGAGTNNTIITRSGTGRLTLLGTNIHIKNILINSSSPDTNPTITFLGPRNNSIENVEFGVNNNSDHISIFSGSLVKINRSIFNAPGGASISVNTTASQVLITDCFFEGNGTAINTTLMDNYNIKGCTFRLINDIILGGTNGIFSNNNISFSVETVNIIDITGNNNTISNNIFTNNNSATNIINIAPNLNGIIIESNNINNNTGNGLNINTTSQVVMNGNKITDNTGNGIVSRGACNIIGNFITNNTVRGIDILSNAGETQIEGNNISPSTTNNAITDDTIRVDSTNNNNTVKVLANKVVKQFTVQPTTINGYNDTIIITISTGSTTNLTLGDLTNVSRGHRLTIIYNNPSVSTFIINFTTTTSLFDLSFLNGNHKVDLIWLGEYWTIEGQLASRYGRYNPIRSIRKKNSSQNLPLFPATTNILFDTSFVGNQINYTGGIFSFTIPGIYQVNYSIDVAISGGSGIRGFISWISFSGDTLTRYGYCGRTNSNTSANTMILSGSSIFNITNLGTGTITILGSSITSIQAVRADSNINIYRIG